MKMAATVIHTCLFLVHFVFVCFYLQKQMWTRLESFRLLDAVLRRYSRQCSRAYKVQLYVTNTSFPRCVPRHQENPASLKEMILSSPLNTFHAPLFLLKSHNASNVFSIEADPPLTWHTDESCSFFFFTEKKSKLGRLASPAWRSSLVHCRVHLSAPKHTDSRGFDSLLISLPEELQKVQMRHMRLQDTVCSNECAIYMYENGRQ